MVPSVSGVILRLSLREDVSISNQGGPQPGLYFLSGQLGSELLIGWPLRGGSCCEATSSSKWDRTEPVRLIPGNRLRRLTWVSEDTGGYLCHWFDKQNWSLHFKTKCAARLDEFCVDFTQVFFFTAHTTGEVVVSCYLCRQASHSSASFSIQILWALNKCSHIAGASINSKHLRTTHLE